MPWYVSVSVPPWIRPWDSPPPVEGETCSTRIDQPPSSLIDASPCADGARLGFNRVGDPASVVLDWTSAFRCFALRRAEATAFRT